MAQEHQVIVIGAGLSGLSAAKLLTAEGIDTLLIEARDRVGGRTLTKYHTKINYVDIGGAYVGPTQDRLLRLAKEMGVENYKVNEVEDLIHYRNGRRKRFQANSLPLRRNPFANMDINYILYLMDEMGKKIPADAPWDAPDAEEWDTMTYKDFLLKTCWTKEAVQFFYHFITINITSEAYEASLLSFLWYVKQCGGLKRIFSTTNGGQERKFIGGSQQISTKMAELLGDAVLLGKPVVAINQDEKEIKVKTLDGKEYTAKYLILATPPAVQMKIHYDPPLPPLRNQLLQRMPMGTVMKCILYYTTAFWRPKGLCGSILVEGNDDHPAFFILDDTKHDGTHPALIGFVAADKLRRLVNLSPESRKLKLAQSIATATGCPEALKPIHYEEKNWMEEQYSGGCYTAMYPPGLLTRYGRVIRQPVGHIYFAGTETATQWSGYMEGAVQAGERAAREILYDMGKISCEQIFQKEPPSEDVIAMPFETSCMEKYLPSVSGFIKFMCFSSMIGVISFSAFTFNKCLRR